MLKNLIVGACAVVLLAGLWLFLKPEKLATQGGDVSLSYFLNVSNGIVAGPEVLVAREGYPVEIVISSDISDLVHLHGYELQEPIQAGQTITLLFEASIAGRYVLELENSGIPLASLEVYPR
ncbi:MAG: hypothetical protein OXT49_01330 [Gammaproteobacteria bacterium]|nr:hypothetical protein [Gammaproteobacteria bacterium]